MKSVVAKIGIGIGVVGFVGGCHHREEPMPTETRTTEEEENERTGISFDMESDSLEEEIEDVRFGA